MNRSTMILKCLYQREYEDNDIYIMSTLLDFIVINDNYSGLVILDLSLNFVKKISLLNELIITEMYKNFSQRQVLIYSHDSKCFVFVDIIFSTYVIFDLQKEFDGIIFSKLYYWTSTHFLLLTDYQHGIYLYSITENILRKIDLFFVKEHYSDFYTLWLKVHRFSPTTISDEEVIYCSEEIIFCSYNHKTGDKHCERAPAYQIHDVIYYQQQWIFLAEDVLCFYSDGKNNITLTSEDRFFFARAIFLDRKTIACLIGSKADQRNSILRIYSLPQN